MSTQAQVNPRLAALTEAGTAVWLDQIRRSLIEGGELQRLVDEDSLRGVTSNPSIFEKAILGSEDYDSDLEAMAKEGLDAKEIYDRIAVQDVQMAADVLRPVHDRLDGADGFVSLEVHPDLARDMEATLDQARDYWKRVDRPNLMIKIPGTDEGIPAIEQAIYEGINVNVTLLFSTEAYATVAEAFVRGLERRHEEGKDLAVHSVASFFVSRVDSEVDKRLEKLDREDLAGTAAVANARAAYKRFEEIFRGERFATLRDAGAPVQRPLWASTGVKNPKYPDTKYVDELVGADTVNTMPMQTLLAAAERAEITDGTAALDPEPPLEALTDAGIDMKDVTDKLLSDGIDLFVDAMNDLIEGVDDRRDAVVTSRPPTIQASIPKELEGPIAQRVEKATERNVTKGVWSKDATLWKPEGTAEIEDRLGWLTISESMLEAAPDIRAFADEVQADGITDVALLGMGGSSLGPEVIRRSFGHIEGALRLHVLDSTDPAAVRELESSIDVSKTLFLVSSKSGGTIETLSHFRHFFERTGRNGRQFTAITDPGSPLVKLANENGFRRVFENDPNIGGRYSVLSYFGLVPAALMGVSVEALLHRAQVAEQNCNSYESGASNSGLWMGLVAGELALQGRDKLTFVVSEPISSFGLWAEQLVAESLGKEGKGILPVAVEPLGDPGDYGEDRVFVYLRNADEPDEALDAKVDALAKAGHPALTLSVHGPTDLGRVFFFAEFAVAVAGWVLEVNPFDQPNVQEAKDNTAKVLDEYRASGSLPEVQPADDAALAALLDTSPPHYIAVLGYLAPSDAFDQAVAGLRAAIRAKTGCASTFGYGPRFQHSTGQMHKGGPKTGVFLQLLHDEGEDVEVAGEDYTFRTLKHAAAIGDLNTLRDHGLPAERVNLEGDPAEALNALTAKIKEL